MSSQLTGIPERRSGSIKRITNSDNFWNLSSAWYEIEYLDEEIDLAIDLSKYRKTEEDQSYFDYVKNNDGRDFCYWCGEKTALVDSGIKFYNVCLKCKK